MIGTTRRHRSIRRIMSMFSGAAAALSLLSGAAWAQGRVEFGSSYGYQFGGRINTNVGTIETADHANFGFTFDLTVNRTMQIEISYSRQNSQAALLPYGNTAIFVAYGRGYMVSSMLILLRGDLTAGLFISL